MTEQTARIMELAKDNTLVAVILTGVDADKIARVLESLEFFEVTRDMILCFWNHIAGKDRKTFDDYILSLTKRPIGCALGCTWPGPKVDESAIFGKLEKESFRECAMEACEVPSKYYCSRCYCVRYCSPLCQQHDFARHNPECKKTVDAVLLLRKMGEAYAKRVIKNNISISDTAWHRLWAKHGKRESA